MKIGIFFGDIAPSGGTRAALDLAKSFRDIGNDVKVFVVGPRKIYMDWYDFDGLNIEAVPFAYTNIKKIDVAIATGFVTWDYISRLDTLQKFGYAQGTESRFYDDEDMIAYVRECFDPRHGILPISVSRNVTRWLEEDIGYTDVVEIEHGANRIDWYAEPWFPKTGRTRVLISGQYERKMNLAKDIDGIAFSALSGLDVEIFHTSIGPSTKASIADAHWVSPSTAWLRRIYSSCDLAVVATRFEGSPVLDKELMACGIPIVRAITSGEGDHDLHDGYNALVSEYNDLASTVINAKRMIGSHGLREKISRNGIEYIASLPDWKEVARKWMEVIER